MGQITFMRLHDKTYTNFETGEVLNNAYNVKETRILNDVSALEFDYPYDEKARMIQPNMLISIQGRIYEVYNTSRNMNGTDVLHVKCTGHCEYEGKNAFIPNIPDHIGETSRAVLQAAVTIISDFKKKVNEDCIFHVMTDSELAEHGLKWVADNEILIDFFSTDKTNLWDVMQTIIEDLGRGEIYCVSEPNRCNIAIVDRIGDDYGVRLRLEKNMTDISVEHNTKDMITRLWAFGSDDLTVASVNGGKAYIDSPNIAKYGVQEGYKDYSDYVSADKLLRNAKWEFDEDNEDRIDVPQLTISGKLIDLSKLNEYGDLERIDIGDTVHVFDLDGTEYTTRVVEMQAYPLEPKETNISLGHLRNNFFIGIWQQKVAKEEFRKLQTTNKNLSIRNVQGTVNTDRNKVQSDNKQLLLDGDLLYIEDNKGRRRINLGNMDGKFVFELFNQLKKKTIEMDEDGNVTITGIFATGTDTEARTVIDKNGIQSYDAAGNRYGLWCNAPSSNDMRYTDFNLYYNNKCIFQIYNAISGILLRTYGLDILSSGNGTTVGKNKWKFEQGASGTFQTADGKTVTVSGGLITSIS